MISYVYHEIVFALPWPHPINWPGFMPNQSLFFTTQYRATFHSASVLTLCRKSVSPLHFSYPGVLWEVILIPLPIQSTQRASCTHFEIPLSGVDISRLNLLWPCKWITRLRSSYLKIESLDLTRAMGALSNSLIAYYVSIRTLRVTSSKIPLDSLQLIQIRSPTHTLSALLN